MKKYLSRGILLSTLLILLAGSVIQSAPQSASAQTVVTLRIGTVEDPNPSGPLFTSALNRRSWSAIIDGRTGNNKVIVVEVSDPAPESGSSDSIDQLQVRVTSTSDSTGIPNLVIRETSATSGIYRGSFILDRTSTSPSTHPGIADPTHASRPSIEAEDGHEVKVNYRSRVVRLTVESDLPRIRSLLPEHETFHARRTFRVSAEVTDDDSGIDEDDIFFLMSSEQLDDSDIFDRRSGDPLPLNQILADNAEIMVMTPSRTMEIRNSTRVSTGFEAETDIFVDTVGGFGEIYVTVAALDTAGNLMVMDVHSDDDVVFARYTVDTLSPELFLVRTGVDFDTRAKQLKGNQRSKLQLIFREQTAIDPMSINASDFQVPGHSIIKVDWFDNNPISRDVDGSSLTSSDPRSFIRRMVFLTVTPDLAPDERPDVFIVPNGVMDSAGNVLRSASTNARDSIGPQLSLRSITTSLAGRDTRVEVEITSEESLGSNRRPTLLVNSVTNPANTLTAAVQSTGTNRWKAIISQPTVTGIYNIFAVATDRDGNLVTLGIEPVDLAPADGVIDGFFDSNDNINRDAVYFEADRDLPNPLVTPRNGGEIAQRDTVFMTIDFGVVGPGETLHEGNEYRGDTRKKVTLTQATLDGLNVLGDATSADNIKWLIPVNNLPLGDHTLVINARDEAGNALDRDLEIGFSVKTGDRFTMTLEPGWNLISFPSTPANAAIDAVFPSSRPVKTVFSFHPTVPGGWTVAARDRLNGTFLPFIGDIKDIAADRGYWVLSDTAEEISLELMSLKSGSSPSAPPSIPQQIQVFEGWNLVPVLSPTGQLAFGDVIDSDVYFSGMEEQIVRIYTFDTIASQWKLVVRDGRTETGTQDQLTRSGVPGACATCPLAENEMVIVGKAYWLFASDHGTVVP